MKTSLLTFLIYLGLSTLLFAQNEYGENLLKNGDFESGDTHWESVSKAGEIVTNVGCNNSNGFIYTRTNDDYHLVSQIVSSEKLKEGKFYEFGTYLKQIEGGGGTLCAEFYNGNKYMGGVYTPYLKKPSEWEKKTDFIGKVPETATSVRISLYMQKKLKGKVIFDNVYLREIKNYWQLSNISTLFPIPVNDLINLQFKVVSSNLTNNKVNVTIKQENAKFSKKISNLPIKKNLIDFKFIFPTVGTYNLEFDFGNKKLNSQIIVSPQKESKVIIDNFNRIKISGKKFLPIGLYTHQFEPEDLEIIAKSSFNTVLSYNTMTWKMPKDKRCSISTIRQIMDKFAEKNIKVIFSIKDVFKKSRYPKLLWFQAKGEEAVIKKIVKEFKNHDALLAWYMCDEFPPDMNIELTQRKNLLNKIDSKHPALSVYCKYSPLYVDTCNLFGADPYPITLSGKDLNHMNAVYVALEKIKDMYAPNPHPPLWAVPQAFNWGNYKAESDKDYFSNYRFPTAQELRSMNFLYVIYGAKGFIFYSFYDFFRGPDKQNFQKNWPITCAAAKQLKDLQSFILSDIPAQYPQIKVMKGKVKAVLMENEQGKHALVIAAIGPGQAEAEIIIPKTIKLKSKFEKTKEISSGKYHFKGSNIDSDLLLD